MTPEEARALQLDEALGGWQELATQHDIEPANSNVRVCQACQSHFISTTHTTCHACREWVPIMLFFRNFRGRPL